MNVDPFRKAQATGVDQREAGLETRFIDLSKEKTNIMLREDGGDGLAMLDLDIAKDAPLGRDTNVIMEEDTQGDLGLVHGGRLVILLLA